MDMKAVGFQKKIEQNNIKALWLWEYGRFFWQIMGMRAVRFLKNLHFFWQIWALELWFFLKKSEKRKYPIAFFEP